MSTCWRNALERARTGPAGSGWPGAVRVHRQLGTLAAGGRAVASGPTGKPAESAGTHARQPGPLPGPIAAAARAGSDLAVRPRRSASTQIKSFPRLVVTVCDQAHEELEPDDDWLHWSIPDPVPAATKAAFDARVAELRERIERSLGDSEGAA